MVTNRPANALKRPGVPGAPVKNRKPPGLRLPDGSLFYRKYWGWRFAEHGSAPVVYHARRQKWSAFARNPLKWHEMPFAGWDRGRKRQPTQTQNRTARRLPGFVRGDKPSPSSPTAMPPPPRGRLQAMPESLPSRQRRPLGGAVERSETEGVSAGKLPQSKPDGFASSLGEGASGETGHFALEQGAFPPCQRPHPRGGCLRSRLGEFPGRWDDLKWLPLRSSHN